MQIRHDLLNNVKSQACDKCWSIENLGQDSRRIQENRFLDWKLDRDIEKIQQECIEDRAEHLLYQIECSNLCNQACVTCNGDLSTKWQEIERQNGVISLYQARYLDIDSLQINFDRAQRINFVGGEPAFDPRTFRILEKLLEHGNDQCFISFVTNGGILPKKKQMEILQKFKNINICFSIDGIETRFEYMRWPGNWKKLLETMGKYQSITENFSVSYTISSVNCIYYEETIEWFEKQSLRYNHNLVYHPSWASLEKAPIAIKKHINNIDFFKNIAEPTGEEFSCKDLLQNLTYQDRLKKITLHDYMPELYQLLTK